ncbi:MAG: flagellar hook protein FlgE [Candidatus Omnitrophica bacterium]|nr:flagellar hook protein FlgE [Candidatus Omnitrophota bacterium]
MLRSMFTGISGLRNHQVRLDVVANNIANINTVGFKRSRAQFSDILSQLLQGASAPTTGPGGDIGGTNPKQVGLGMTIASIDTLFTQGNLQLTGVNTDIAIQGDGMFNLRDADGVDFYTRAGQFTFSPRDAAGNIYLQNVSNGYRVQGYVYDATLGAIDNTTITDILIPPTLYSLAPQATSQTVFNNNLNAETIGSFTSNVTSQTITDGDGAGSTTITWTFTPTSNFNEWQVTGTLSGATATWGSSGTNTLTYTFRVDDTGAITGTAGEVWADTAPVGGIDTIDIDGVAGADVQVNLISSVGPTVLDGTIDDITITTIGILPDTVDANYAGTWTASSTHTASINIYDSMGATHTLQLLFRHDPQVANQWSWTAQTSDTSITVNTGDGVLAFNNDGSLSSSVINNPINISVNVPAAAPINITTPDFSAVTQYAANNTLVAFSQNGYEAGELNAFTIGSSGVITGIYTNGLNGELAQVVLARFDNPGGLVKEGDNLFSQSANSGMPDIGVAETGGRGSLSAGFLEMSNVDLAQEFVDMITAQRGFQVNSRSITVSDEILQELLTLKR